MARDHWYPTGTLKEPFLPQDISEAQWVFPAGVASLMPPEEYITSEFYQEYEYTKFGKFLAACFYSGIKNPKFYPKEGIDAEKAYRHIFTILGSYEPKHEYKMSACTYLMTLWFEDVEWK